MAWRNQLKQVACVVDHGMLAIAGMPPRNAQCLNNEDEYSIPHRGADHMNDQYESIIVCVTLLCARESFL
jgi:hypothetical protein